MKPLWVFAYWWVFNCFKLSRALSVGFDGHRVKPFVACEYGMGRRPYRFSCIFLFCLLLFAPSSWCMLDFPNNAIFFWNPCARTLEVYLQLWLHWVPPLHPSLRKPCVLTEWVMKDVLLPVRPLWRQLSQLKSGVDCSWALSHLVALPSSLSIPDGVTWARLWRACPFTSRPASHLTLITLIEKIR